MTAQPGLKIAVSICILQSEAGFLLLHRAKEPHLGKYIPVGGKIDPYESPRQAAIREVWEEAHIRIETVKLCGILTESSPVDYNYVVYIYTSEVPYFSPGHCDEGTLEWIDMERLYTIPIPETDPFIYDRVRRNEFFVFNSIYDENINLLTLCDEMSGEILFEAK